MTDWLDLAELGVLLLALGLLVFRLALLVRQHRPVLSNFRGKLVVVFLVLVAAEATEHTVDVFAPLNEPLSHLSPALYVVASVLALLAFWHHVKKTGIA